MVLCGPGGLVNAKPPQHPELGDLGTSPSCGSRNAGGTMCVYSLPPGRSWRLGSPAAVSWGDGRDVPPSSFRLQGGPISPRRLAGWLEARRTGSGRKVCSSCHPGRNWEREFFLLPLHTPGCGCGECPRVPLTTASLSAMVCGTCECQTPWAIWARWLSLK